MSATVSIDLTQSLILSVLRTALLSILPVGIEVLQSEINRVAEPIGPDFVMLTPTGRSRLTQDIATWFDGMFATPPVPGTRMDMQETELRVQLDVHGPNSADNTQIITTLFRSEVLVLAFAATGLAIAPLYAEDARQMPFINAEQQYEYRWTVDVVMQVNPVVTSPQDFAAVLKANLDGFA